MSIAICLLLITSISTPFTQNGGQPQNAGQSQNISQPTSSSSGSGGLTDSPWPMFGYNPQHTGLSPFDTSGTTNHLKWTFLAGRIRSSPVIGSDETIYVGSDNGNLYAINQDGSEKWHFSLIGNGFSPGIGPDGTIYIGCLGGKFYAINPNGTEKWNFTMGNRAAEAPTISSDGTIYVGSTDGNLYAINPDGTEKWRFPTIGGVYESPAISFDGTIYTDGGGKLYAISPNGTEKWNFDGGGGVQSPPAIGSDGTIYVGSKDHNFYAIYPNGTEKWHFVASDDVGTSPAIGSDGTIYVGSDDYNLYAIYPDGSEKWRFTTNLLVQSSPAIGSDGTVYLGSDDDNIYAINPDGTEKWNVTLGAYVHSSPAIGSDGTIYICSWEGSGEGSLHAIGNPILSVNVTSHFSELNSAAQSTIIVHVTDGTNPVQGATVNLVSDNGGIFNPQSGITDANGDFKSIFNAPTIISQIICRISAEASKTGYNDGSGYVDVTINPIPWPMFRQNLNHTGVSPYDTSANPGKLRWSFQTNSILLASPVIGSDGTIYIGTVIGNTLFTNNFLYAINPDGSEKWNFTTDFHIHSSPSIGSDGTIYVGSEDNNLYAINPNGTLKWSYTTGSYLIDWSSPIIGSDGTIYIGSEDNKLYAINPNGTLKWNKITGGPIESSPAIGLDGTIYIGSNDHKLYAINPDSTEKWSFITGGLIRSSPAIGPDNTIYIGSDDNKLYAINPDGTEKWSYTTSHIVKSSPAIGSDGTIYVGSLDGKLYAINPNGTEKWIFLVGPQVTSSPAIGLDGTIYIGSWDNNLFAINPDSTEKWSFITNGYLESSPAIGIDGTIYVGSWDGYLYAINEGGVPPIAIAGPDQTIYEGYPVQLDASASFDPDGTIESYEWDFDSSDGLWWNTGAFPDANGPSQIHTYGDDGIYIATLRVIDNDNLSATDTCNVTVQNVDPTVTIKSIKMELEIGLRVAGRKYNNVSMALYEDGSQLGYVSIERMPGSPDEQMAWIPVRINFSKSYNATVTYTPEDPPNVGGNPVWIYLKSKNGSIKKIHHTFNVQQSKKRDSEHWNHVEPWEVDLNGYFVGLSFEITSHITDPGSDDETLTFTYGSQVKTVTYLNNPPNPDPYPSPEVNPVEIFDTTTLVYEGLGIITLVVKDDDNIRSGIGEGSDSIIL